MIVLNLLGNAYQTTPIGITVEGSNTLTKNLIIFGQGLMKSHPYLYNLVQSIEQDNLDDFKKNLNGMLSHSIKTTTLGFYYALASNLLFRSNCQLLIEEKYINNFALTSNLVLLMGKKFKTNELTSGKMAEVLGSLYIIQALDWFNQNNECQLTHLVKHAKYEEYNKIQKNLKHISDNFPIPGIKQILQIVNSESYSERNLKISDVMIKETSNSITKNKKIREILSENIYKPQRLQIMNDNLMSIINYHERKDKSFKKIELDTIIDEITKVDEFEK